MDLSDEQRLLEEPEFRRSVLQEWHIYKDVLRQSPVHFAVYDKNDNLIFWNKAYEDNHPEAFKWHRERAEAKTLTYRELLQYEISKTTPSDEIEAQIEQRLNAHRTADGTPVNRYYDSVGHLKIYKYKTRSDAVAGFAMDINDLMFIQSPEGGGATTPENHRPSQKSRA